MHDTQRIMPLARSADLVVEPVADETLVYDLRTHHAHCLNPPAALLWAQCDGRSTYADAAERLGAALGGPVDPAWITLGLDQLPGDRAGQPGDRDCSGQRDDRVARDEPPGLHPGGGGGGGRADRAVARRAAAAAAAYAYRAASRRSMAAIRRSRRTRTSRRRARGG